METSPKNRVLMGFVWGAIVAAIFVVLVTILGELLAPLKNFLKEQHHHHWVGKGIWTVSIFIIVAVLFCPSTRRKFFANDQIAQWVTVLSWIMILGSVILFGFFLYEYLIHH